MSTGILHRAIQLGIALVVSAVFCTPSSTFGDSKNVKYADGSTKETIEEDDRIFLSSGWRDTRWKQVYGSARISQRHESGESRAVSIGSFIPKTGTTWRQLEDRTKFGKRYVDWSGDWSTRWESKKDKSDKGATTLALTQAGNKVSGSYGLRGGKLTVMLSVKF